jgi:hypothetical protein
MTLAASLKARPKPQSGAEILRHKAGANPRATACDQVDMIAYLRSKLAPTRPSMASVHARADVNRIAPSDPAGALTVAHRIPDGWYRAQALSCVAEHAPGVDVAGILGEAVAAAHACEDAYNTVAVMSWPLRAALKRGRRGYARAELERVLRLAPGVEPRASRIFALQCLWSGCDAADEEFAELVWQTILALCNPDHHWRAARLFRHVAEVRESRRPGSAASVIGAMPVGKAKTALARRFKLA